MRIAITGSSGFIGSALVPALRLQGHEVVRLVRRAGRAPDEVSWDPGAGLLDLNALGRLDAAISLAGAGVGDKRWSSAYKETVRRSRVDTTGTLCRELAALDPPPRVLLSGSAIGFYGDTGDHAVDETGPAGSTFLAGVVRDWEAAARPAQDAGIRVAFLRTGLVMDRGGGAFARLFPLLRLGLGGPIGSGRQYWSWITLADSVRAIQFLLEDGAPAGPVNLTAPEPVTNRELVRALGKAMHRPALLPAPAPALRIALGEFAGEILRSQRVLPRRLLDAGFAFESPDIASAAATLS